MKKIVTKNILFAIILQSTFLLFAGFIPQRLCAQNEVMAFTKQIGGSGEDIGSGVAVDSKGNIYCAGLFSLTVDFDPGPGTNTMTSLGAFDCYILKLNPFGNLLWAKQFGGALDDMIISIKTDSLDNIFMSGRFSQTVDFDLGPNSFTMTAAGIQPNGFILKIDSAGDFKWAKQFVAAFPNELSVDAIGNCYFSGAIFGLENFDPGVTNFTLNASQPQGFIAKLDSGGAFKWAGTFTGAINNYAYNLYATRGGEVFIGGSFEGLTDFDPGAGTFTLVPANWTANAFIVKLDAAGSFIWAKQFRSDYGCGVHSILPDPLGNLYVSGMFVGVVDFDPSAATYVGSSRVDLQACKLEYSIVSPK